MKIMRLLQYTVSFNKISSFLIAAPDNAQLSMTLKTSTQRSINQQPSKTLTGPPTYSPIEALEFVDTSNGVTKEAGKDWQAIARQRISTLSTFISPLFVPSPTDVFESCGSKK
jgi:hypothetical protein